MAGDGETMGWKQPGIAFFLYILLQQHPVITFLSMKAEMGKEVAHSLAQTVKNGQKRPKMKYLAIFDHFSPFEPAQRQPIDPTSTFIE